jgi:hypothetical protein
VLRPLVLNTGACRSCPVAPASTVCAIDSRVSLLLQRTLQILLADPIDAHEPSRSPAISLTRARGSSRTAILQLGMPR